MTLDTATTKLRTSVTTFAGQPTPVLGTGRIAHKVVGYQGTSPYGEPLVMSRHGHRSAFTLVDMGEREGPSFALDQRVCFSETPRQVTAVRLRKDGWWYLTVVANPPFGNAGPLWKPERALAASSE
ncbi:hypothetical protein PV379_01905 [Streptomyces caniscabiei]|uniref:hypothetical protein n=1 Tax=Streptomyces caniscabiei TaxID=2746961 RepID=UPI0029BFA75C|nr:hypothetical protein [Streptomyces caniscabiei]MDX2776107.1 hypothetical protein [Streptomyces caniscabiei]